MTLLRPPIAKLTRPTLQRIQARPRLFDRLGQQSSQPVVWVCAPPGYGKTSLVASYLEHSPPATEIWYQADADDSDAASFLYYLSLCAAPHTRPQDTDLPLFAGQLAGDLPRFARAFFRQFYARLKPPAVVVFDDVHELSGDGLAALAVGLGEVPAGVTVVALSREQPPEALARMEANRRIDLVQIDDLCFTDDEVLALAGEDPRIVAQVREMLPRLEGWPAGVALTLEHLSLRRGQGCQMPHADREAVFRYFAGEVFRHAPAEARDVLLACAMLPSVSITHARDLSANAQAGIVLESLHRRRLFVARRGEHEPTYHFHALFHEFLRAEVEYRFNADARRDLAVRSARLLASAGRCEEAALLFRRAGDWAGLVALLAAQAGQMLRQGRGLPWRTWLGWLPERERAADRWLLYWDGVSQLRSAPPVAKDILERAYQAFSAAGDTRGCLLTAADLILFHHYERADYSALPRWVAAIRADIGQLDQDAELLSAEERLRVRSATLIGLLFHRPDDPMLQQCVAQVRQGIHAVEHPDDMVAAGTILLQYLNLNEGGKHAAPLIALLDPIAQQPQVCPFVLICWQARVAFNQYLGNDFSSSEATSLAARRSAETYGLSHLVAMLDFNTVVVQLAANQLDAARATLDGMCLLLCPTRRLDSVYFQYLQISLQLRLEDTDGLVDKAVSLLQLAQDVAMPTIHLSHFMTLRAGCHLVAQDYGAAEHWFEQAAASASSRNAERHEVLCRFARAYRMVRSGRAGEAVPLLASAFADHRRLQWVPLLASLHNVLQTLCAAAIEAGVETEHVRSIVASRKLAPPHYYLSNWPWSIRLRLLGKFSLAIAGEEVLSRGKLQKRPLELLSALVASGRGEVDAIWLRDRLWPDADGAAARTALDTTLYRLRKLLRSETAVYLSSGHIGLDRRALWTDVWALTVLAEEVDAIRSHSPAWHVEKLTSHLFDLYRGPFSGEDGAAWTITARNQSRDRFVRAIAGLGSYWERRSDWANAAALYTRALQVDDLAEPFYQGLIRCAMASNDPVSALTVYHRCANILASVLGTRPSTKTWQSVSSLLMA